MVPAGKFTRALHAGHILATEWAAIGCGRPSAYTRFVARLPFKHTIERTSRHVPGLRRLPMFKLLALGRWRCWSTSMPAG